jgi:hypothetical protein
MFHVKRFVLYRYSGPVAGFDTTNLPGYIPRHVKI